MSRSDARLVISADNRTGPAFDQVQSNLQRMTALAGQFAKGLGGIAAGGGAVVTALVASTQQLAEQGRELEKNALKAGVTVEQMQALEFASRQFNIEGADFADIMRDARERVGDFLATGAGPMADFFENVAPLVGVTAEELSHLSGPEVLVRFKQALDEAGVAEAEQLFYLEQLASNASDLAPLLANNADQLNRLTGEFGEMGAAMSAADIAQLKEMDRQISDVSHTMQVAFAQAVVGAGDQLQWLSDHVSHALKWWGALFDSMRDDPRTVDGLVDKLADLRGELAGLKNSSADATYMLTGESVAQARARLEGEIDRLQATYNRLRFGMPLPEGDAPAAAPSPLAPPKASVQEAKNDVNQLADEYRNAGELMAAGMAKPASTLADLLAWQQQAGAGGGELADQYALAAHAMAAAFREPASTLEELEEQSKSVAQRLHDELGQASLGIGDLFEDQISRFSAGMGDAFETAVFDSENFGDAIGGMFENMGRAVVGFFGEWAAQRMAQWVLERTLLAGESAGYIANVTGRGMAETQLGALNAAASIAAIPIIGPAMAPGAALAFEAFGAGLTAAAATAAGTALAGIAHGGLDYVPAESTYLLQKGERVLSPKQNQDFTAFMSAGQGGGAITFNITGTDPVAIGREVVRRMNQKNKRLDKLVAKSAARGRAAQGKSRL